MADKCRCGADFQCIDTDGITHWWCGTRLFPEMPGLPEKLDETRECLRRQLAQAKELLGKLEEIDNG